MGYFVFNRVNSEFMYLCDIYMINGFKINGIFYLLRVVIIIMVID